MYVAHHRRRLVCSLEEWTSGEPGIDLVPVTHRLEPHVFEDLDRLPSRGGRRTSRRLSDLCGQPSTSLKTRRSCVVSRGRCWCVQ